MKINNWILTAIVLFMSSELLAQDGIVKPPIAPQYDNRFGFNLGRLVYERTKNDDMYYALDVWAGWPAFIRSHTHCHHKTFIVAEAEARFGYNFFYKGRDHLTPLVGLGYLYNDRSFCNEQFIYGTAGFKYSHEFNTVFGLGLNLKLLTGSSVREKAFSAGVDTSMPIIFRFAHYRHWDVTLEPYLLYMYSSHKNTGLLGARGTFGYRF